jgi:hypothetical protein
MANNTYMLYVQIGGAQKVAYPGATCVHINPSAPTLDSVIEALTKAPITAADLRTKTLVVCASSDPQITLLTYTALCGFAARFLDYTTSPEVFLVRPLIQQMQSVPDPGKPETIEEVLLVGTKELNGIGQLEALTMSDFIKLRYARKALVVVQDLSVAQTLERFLVVATARTRKHTERYPYILMDNISAAAGVEAVLSGTPDVIFDLDAIRKASYELRTMRRFDDRSSLVPAEDLSPRRRRLLKAATEIPMEGILLKLGSIQNKSTGLWRCPRPQRHRNGDADPSSEIKGIEFRCFRCDLEHIDALRLVMDALNLGPDEAADWLLKSKIKV